MRNRKKLWSIDNKQKKFPDSRFFVSESLIPMNKKIAEIYTEN